MAMSVWIDQDLCTGDGICVEIAAPVFKLLDDGLAYVYDASGTKKMTETVAVVAKDEDSVIEAAEECPGECIFIEIDDA